MASLLFLPIPALHSVRRPRVDRNGVCAYRFAANINEARDQAREDEIAAKIANLRKQKRLQSQRTSAAQSEDKGEEKRAEERQGPPSLQGGEGSIFDDLPDWKKEEILLSQMQEAERFFNRGVQDMEGFAEPTVVDDGKQTDETYKPKVSTWGVFPRPDNISKTFGGGRRIETGGVDLEGEEAKARDEAVKKKLDAYRASRGIDVEKEAAHREEIEAALLEAEKLMKKTLPYEAAKALETVSEYTSDRSRLGGKVLLSLAFAYEAVGRRQDARQLYVRLRKNAFPEISGRAKQLIQGFEAMEKLGVEDETQAQGYRVTKFSLPDINYASEKRYETVVVGKDGEGSSPAKVSAQTSLLLFAVMVSPALVILGLVLWRR